MEPKISIITLGVNDLKRSYEFYHTGLGLPTSKTPNDGIIFFQTLGTCFTLYLKRKGFHVGRGAVRAAMKRLGIKAIFP
jgi:catechol 2,3-dioxygenase-like lactoylglutathione lyase family enzyme